MEFPCSLNTIDFGVKMMILSRTKDLDLKWAFMADPLVKGSLAFMKQR